MQKVVELLRLMKKKGLQERRPVKHKKKVVGSLDQFLVFSTTHICREGNPCAVLRGIGKSLCGEALLGKTFPTLKARIHAD